MLLCGKSAKEPRLDRAFATDSWWNLFPLCTLSVFHVIKSDHDLIKLNLFNMAVTKKQFRFKFKNTWLKEAGFHSEVSKFWQDLPPFHLLSKLISMSSFMARWERRFFHKFREKVIKQKEVLDALKNREDDDEIQSYFDEKAKMEELLLHEEIYWKQHEKTFWLEEGDTNSKFFHATTSSRKKINHISSLKSDDDVCGLILIFNIFSGLEYRTNHS